MAREPLRIGVGGRSIVSGAGSNGTLSRVERQLSPANAIREPSRENEKKPLHADGVVTGSGVELVRPVVSSIAIRQRFIVPPRRLEKYRNAPSGDHAGLQSTAASAVTSSGPRSRSEPSAAAVQMSRWPVAPRRLQKATRWPCGDQAGCIASVSLRSWRIAPVATFTAVSPPPTDPRSVGE